MPARTPEEALQQITEAISAQDMDAVLALYEPGATLAPEPGKTVTGTAALREAFAGFLALRPSLQGDVDKVLQADDLALVCGTWRLTGTDPDGNAVEMGGRSTDVCRRQPDGSWLFVIDNPWGVD